MFSVLWRRDSGRTFVVCGRVHAWREYFKVEEWVHVCTNQSDANLQSVWLSQIDLPWVNIGVKTGEHTTFNLVSDFNDYLLSGQYCTGQHGGCRSCMWTWFLYTELRRQLKDDMRRNGRASRQVKMIENHGTSERQGLKQSYLESLCCPCSA